jgi:hypothetical protein
VVFEPVGTLLDDQCPAVFQSPEVGELTEPPPVYVAAADTVPDLTSSAVAAAAITISCLVRL